MPQPIEILMQYCDQFIASKRAGGLDYWRQEIRLRKFLASLPEYLTDEVELPKDAVLAWNSRKNNEKPNTRRGRMTPVREFALYLNTRGIPAYVPTPIRDKSPEFVPYIFTNNELARFFTAVDNRPNVARVCKDWLVMPTLFRTIYACGLRRSEACALRVCDVDLDSGIMTILATKFHKDRLIPLHTDFLLQLREYSAKALSHADKQSPFFPTTTGKFYSSHSIYGAFRKFLWDAGISHGGKGRGPRLHDLRHSFAVHCLRRWVLAEEDLTTKIPYLSAYMGHVHYRHTQVYLHLTAEMYPDIVAKMEKAFDVLPETEGYYEAY
jgi:integrase